jgi:hypothetical protein
VPEKTSFVHLTIPNPSLTPVDVYARLNPAGGGFILDVRHPIHTHSALPWCQFHA